MTALVRHDQRDVRVDVPLGDAPDAYEQFHYLQDGMIEAIFHS